MNANALPTEDRKQEIFEEALSLFESFEGCSERFPFCTRPQEIFNIAQTKKIQYQIALLENEDKEVVEEVREVLYCRAHDC